MANFRKWWRDNYTTCSGNFSATTAPYDNKTKPTRYISVHPTSTAFFFIFKSPLTLILPKANETILFHTLPYAIKICRLTDPNPCYFYKSLRISFALPRLPVDSTGDSGTRVLSFLRSIGIVLLHYIIMLTAPREVSHGR